MKGYSYVKTIIGITVELRPALTASALQKYLLPTWSRWCKSQICYWGWELTHRATAVPSAWHVHCYIAKHLPVQRAGHSVFLERKQFVAEKAPILHALRRWTCCFYLPSSMKSSYTKNIHFFFSIAWWHSKQALISAAGQEKLSNAIWNLNSLLWWVAQWVMNGPIPVLGPPPICSREGNNYAKALQ